MAAKQMQTPVPPIGQPWEGQGGIYAGVIRGHDGQPDHHLILAIESSADELTWKRAINWASKVKADGHADFSLPTRRESAVLFGNLTDKFEKHWHWTSEQSSDRSAWIQYFYHGDQGSNDKSAELRARAVRRLPISASVLQTQED